MKLNKSDRANIPVAFAAASLLAASVSYVSGFTTAIEILGLFATSLLSTSALSMLLRKTGAAQNARVLSDELVAGMHYALLCRSKGVPMPAALNLAAAGSRDASVKSALSNASTRLKLEGDIEPIFAGMQLTADIRDAVKSSDWSNVPSALEAVTGSYAYELNNRKARVEESIQRYATLNMFLSTILPSFIIFAFIGSMLISQKQESMLYISLVLLIALPIAYALGNMLLSRRLFG